MSDLRTHLQEQGNQLQNATKKTIVDVGSIILAPGYDPFDPSSQTQYGYKRFFNVVTSLEFERMISASGPSGVNSLRPTPTGRCLVELPGFSALGHVTSNRTAHIALLFALYVCHETGYSFEGTSSRD